MSEIGFRFIGHPLAPANPVQLLLEVPLRQALGVDAVGIV